MYIDSGIASCYADSPIENIYSKEDFNRLFLREIQRNEWIDLKCVLQDLNNQDVKTIVFEFPRIEELLFVTESEKYRAEHNITGYTPADTEEHIEYLKRGYRDDYGLYVDGKLATSLTQYERNGIVKLKDYQSDYVNVIDGKRVVLDVPIDCRRKIYVLGPCIVGGAYVTDKYTIPNIIQSKLNKDKIKIEVVNLGTCGQYRSYVSKLQNLTLNKEDIVVVYEINGIGEIIDNTIKLDNVYTHRIEDIFFETPHHMNKYGNSIVAEISYEFVKTTADIKPINHGCVEINGFEDYKYDKDNEIQKWAEKQSKFPHIVGAVYGSIIMNCNPLTLGHKWLIEEALKYSDYLYIFVVEENKSEFSFSERYEMVALCIDSMQDRVKAIPSGKWVLSDATMPEYFTKDQKQEIVVSVSDDLELFAKDVAPLFNITKRFVGEEKADLVTKQYNEGMKRILPQYDIEVVELPRKMIGENPISATSVRAAMKKKDWEYIATIVPETSLEVIKRHIL